MPKFSKFVGELEESIVEHVTHFQVERGDLAIDEFLKMKYFPMNLIYTLTQFEKCCMNISLEYKLRLV